jgi:hypothetical protein
MHPRADRPKTSRVSGAFLNIAREVLVRRGSPTELFGLLRDVLERRPSRLSAEILGQELYKAAKTGGHGFLVESYPRFKLKELARSVALPARGYIGAAFRVLSSPDAPRGYVDVREIARQACDAGVLTTVSAVPEYWMSVKMNLDTEAFLRSGSLMIGLTDWRVPGVGSSALVPRRTRLARGGVQGITDGIYERDLESLLATRLALLEKGLQLVERQCSTPVGRIDLLCKDRRGSLVVVELKSFGARTSEIVDQVTRYMGYLKAHVAAPRQLVRGIIVVGQVEDSLAYAVMAIPNLEIRTFSVTINPAPSFGGLGGGHDPHEAG